MNKTIAAIALTFGPVISGGPAQAIMKPPVMVNDQSRGTGWQADVSAKYGVYPRENVTILYQDEGNCGSEKSKTGTGGGCAAHYSRTDKWVVYVSPSTIGTEWGEFVLYHELGHTVGLEECDSDRFARAITGHNKWGYASCAHNIEPTSTNGK